jgi:hypothetical protein
MNIKYLYQCQNCFYHSYTDDKDFVLCNKEKVIPIKNNDGDQYYIECPMEK